MKKILLFLLCIFFCKCNEDNEYICGCADPYRNVYSAIDLSGLQYDKIKIELRDVSKNISEFYYPSVHVIEVSGVSVIINNEKIKFDDNDHSYVVSWDDKSYRYKIIDVSEIIKAKKSIFIHVDITKFNKSKNKLKNHILKHLLFIRFIGNKSSLGREYSYRLKVDTDGLKANKNIFDKKIEFTSSKNDNFTSIRIDVANKKVKIE